MEQVIHRKLGENMITGGICYSNPVILWTTAVLHTLQVETAVTPHWRVETCEVHTQFAFD